MSENTIIFEEMKSKGTSKAIHPLRFAHVPEKFYSSEKLDEDRIPFVFDVLDDQDATTTFSVPLSRVPRVVWMLNKQVIAYDPSPHVTLDRIRESMMACSAEVYGYVDAKGWLKNLAPNFPAVYRGYLTGIRSMRNGLAATFTQETTYGPKEKFIVEFVIGEGEYAGWYADLWIPAKYEWDGRRVRAHTKSGVKKLVDVLAFQNGFPVNPPRSAADSFIPLLDISIRHRAEEGHSVTVTIDTAGFFDWQTLKFGGPLDPKLIQGVPLFD